MASLLEQRQVGDEIDRFINKRRRAQDDLFSSETNFRVPEEEQVVIRFKDREWPVAKAKSETGSWTTLSADYADLD